MKKTELALLYMPYASADVARRHLNKCIRRNRELLEALEATGWAFWIHWLTPLQVELIEKYLGEPESLFLSSQKPLRRPFLRSMMPLSLKLTVMVLTVLSDFPICWAISFCVALGFS